MKRTTKSAILVILVICFLISCAPGGSQNNRTHCSKGGEICISLGIVPTFKLTEPVQLDITAITKKDMSNLHLTLHTHSEVSIEEPRFLEKNSSNHSKDVGYAYWDFTTTADQTTTFTRFLNFPKEEGYFNVDAIVVTEGGKFVAMESITILLTKSEGKVIKEGTPMPQTTFYASPAAYGPGTVAPTPLSPTQPGKSAPLFQEKTSTPPTPTQSGSPRISPSPTLNSYPAPLSASPLLTQPPYP